MVELEKSYSVSKKGTGRTDNLGKMFASRVQTFKVIELLPNETLKKFIITAADEISLFPWIRPLLPIGGSYHLLDVVTYLLTPYTVAAGYEFKIIKMWASMDQPALGRSYMDTQLIENSLFTAGGVYSEQDIGMLSTADIDSDFSDSHVFDFSLTNIGADPMMGTAVIVALLIDHR